MASSPEPTDFERTALPLLRDCYAFALSLSGNVPDAEDLVQDTFLKAQRSFASFAPGTNAKAWMFTILRRLHIDRHRRAKVRPVATPDEEIEAHAVAPREPEPAEIEGVTPEDVRRALSEVPEAFRLAVRLRDVDGFSYAEIGRILDIPPGTVMSRLHRGRECLRRILVPPTERPEPGGASPPGTSGPRDLGRP